MKDEFAGYDSDMRKQRRRIVRKMKRKYRRIREEGAKRRRWKKGFERKLRDMQSNFRVLKDSMRKELQKTRKSNILKRLDKIQAHMQKRKMKKKALKYIGKMAKKMGKKMKIAGATS